MYLKYLEILRSTTRCEKHLRSYEPNPSRMQSHREHPPLHRRTHFSVVVPKRNSAELAIIPIIIPIIPIIPMIPMIIPSISTTVVVAEVPGRIHGGCDFRVDEIHPDTPSVALRGAIKRGAKHPPVAA